jgi:hypothetical protein
LVAPIRPRSIDAEAYKAEQDAWRMWNQMHLDDEADFKRVKNAASDVLIRHSFSGGQLAAR